MPASTHTARWVHRVGLLRVYGLEACGAVLSLLILLQILYARDVDQRSTTFEKSLLMGKEFQRRAKAMILRAAVLRNQIHVKVTSLGCEGMGSTHTASTEPLPVHCSLLLEKGAKGS